eukprot:gnl/TRDRNA2_/TRDRNA2_185823_c0_seq1.p1 gnl/TRDRNA2_/TRDRNA2_185823_c0~~gnl/TRDRNA2_/TRDRNA2_185823_c0_seq1.p1  ORF type:complete len:378 (-),score=78.92 gnl/TRDRNA2_/TRDRNA2_185823_c0_seq1:68-1201(-)
MGGGGKRGQSGKGKAEKSDRHSPSKSSKKSSYEEEEEWDEQWNQQPTAHGAYFSLQAALPTAGVARLLAAQWRFVCRVLQRYAPQERIDDPRRQLRLGDHIFVRHSWDFGELHGVVCSAAAEDSQHGGRRRDRGDSESHWVVHWSQERASLQCVPIAQFAKSGNLSRVSYPHWLCQCYVPESSTMKPHVVQEKLMEAESDDKVAREANNAYRNSSWAPTWSQACDREFCIHAKTCGFYGPVFELTGSKAAMTSVVGPLGCAIRGDLPPSKVFGFGPKPASSGGGSSKTAPPGYTPSESQSQWSAQPAQQMMTLEQLEAQTHEKIAASYGYGAGWGAGWDGSGWASVPNPAAMGQSSLSADAAVFVMPGMGSQHVVYQ